MITTGSVYDKKLPSEGHRVLVMRRWPRGVKKCTIDKWVSGAAPSERLLNIYRLGNMPWVDFTTAYRRQMRLEPLVLAGLKALERKHGHIILLCWEKEPDKCHRTILKDILAGWKE